MTCPNCQAELPKSAKFCSECGANVESSGNCPNCNESLKPDARFCHSCGEAVGAGSAKPHVGASAQSQILEVKQSWLHSFGAFLFIPIFVGIIVLLFWVNKEPVPVGASNTESAGQNAPDMATMGKIHITLERLKNNLEVNPKDVVSMDSLAIMYSIAGSYDKAVTYYEMHHELEPDNKEVRIALALTYHYLKRSAEAVTLLQEVLNEEPTNAFALHYLAEIHSSMHNHDEAVELWKKIMDSYPGTEMAQMAEKRINETAHADQSN